MTILIKDALVVTGDNEQRQWGNADILIRKDRIADIGPDLNSSPGDEESDMEIIDARRFIAMPGLVNAHLHSIESFEQGGYDNLPLEIWLNQSYPVFGFPELSERELYLQTMLSAIESIRSGVTTVQDDFVFPSETPDPVNASIQAYSDIGLRAWVTVDMWDLPFLECLPYVKDIIPSDIQRELEVMPMVSAPQLIDLFETQYQRWNDYDGRLRIILAPCGPQRCTVELLKEINRLSEEYHVPIHSHALETRLQAVQSQEFFGKTLVEYMSDLGLLSPRLTLVHAIWLTDHDIELLGEHGCSVVHNPLSNLKLGSGICPVRKLINAGVTVGIGSDGLSTSDTGDLIEAIRVASLIHKVGTYRYEDWISAHEVFDMATMGGARTGMMEAEVGSLEPGKKADIILLDKEHWGFIPINDPVRQLAFSVTSEAVQTVIINGQIVMQDRKIMTIDETVIKAEISEAAERFSNEYVPRMRDGAKYLEPYLREMYLRAMSVSLPDEVKSRIVSPNSVAS